MRRMQSGPPPQPETQLNRPASLQLWKLSSGSAMSRARRGPAGDFIGLPAAMRFPRNAKSAQEREQRSLFPPCFFSVILLSPKLSKRVIYLSYFQLAPHRHRCFYGKPPCFLFFQVLSTGSQRKNRVENHACFLKSSAPMEAKRKA